LVLIGNVEINFGVIFILCYPFSDLLELQMLELNTKINTNYIVLSC